MVDRIASAIACGVSIVNIHGRHVNGMAREWAEKNTGAFPGGYLAADLDKYRDAGGVDIRQILGKFLGEIDAMPHRHRALSERLIQYFVCMEKRPERTLITLDNANKAAQVRPFVCPNTLVLVTSARLLGGLIPDRACFVRMIGNELEG